MSVPSIQSNRHRRRRWISAFVAAALSLAIFTGGCGDGGGPMPDGGSARKVVESIRRAKQRQSGLTRAQFCRIEWQGPQLRRATAARLLLDRAAVRTGARVFAQIENLGTSSLGYGVAPEVDQLIRGLWHPRDFERNGVPVGFTLAEWELRPRARSSCLEVPVSDTWSRGLYRVRFLLEKWGRREERSAVRPVAYFKVTGDASRK
jgi:hypothetical protein